jgi:hypothetical protein
MTPDEFRVSDEVLAQLQEACMDRAVKRLEVNIIIFINNYDQKYEGEDKKEKENK